MVPANTSHLRIMSFYGFNAAKMTGWANLGTEGEGGLPQCQLNCCPFMLHAELALARAMRLSL